MGIVGGACGLLFLPFFNVRTGVLWLTSSTATRGATTPVDNGVFTFTFPGLFFSIDIIVPDTLPVVAPDAGRPSMSLDTVVVTPVASDDDDDEHM